MNNTAKLSPVKRIAIVASGENLKDLIEWSYYNKGMLSPHELIAMGQAAYVIEGTVNKKVYSLKNEKEGGYQQLAAMITEKKVDVLLFFDNPMQAAGRANQNKMLLEKAIEQNISIAFNRMRVDLIPAADLAGKNNLDFLYSYPVFPDYEVTVTTGNEQTVIAADAR